jgi:hypothetical protein
MYEQWSGAHISDVCVKNGEFCSSTYNQERRRQEVALDCDTAYATSIGT